MVALMPCFVLRLAARATRVGRDAPSAVKANTNPKTPTPTSSRQAELSDVRCEALTAS